MNFKTIDSQIEYYKAAFSQQGNGFDCLVFRATFRYQYGQGLVDVLRGIVRFISRVAQYFILVAIKSVDTLLKAGSEAIKDSATVKNVIKSTLKRTVGAVLCATVDQVDSKLIEMQDNQNDAPPPNRPIVVPEFVQAGSDNKQHSRSIIKKTPKRTKYSSKQRSIIYNF